MIGHWENVLFLELSVYLYDGYILYIQSGISNE